MMVSRNVAKIGIIQCDDEAIKNFGPIFRMRDRKEKEKEREREREREGRREGLMSPIVIIHSQ